MVKKNLKRKVEIAVLSDIHLGTYGCHAKEVLHYLNSIKPKKLILNGDIIDIWQFRKRYFPKAHLQIIKKVIALATKGTQVYYITGNHDEKLRKFSDAKMGNIQIVDKLILNLNGKKAWFFHGDVFLPFCPGSCAYVALGNRPVDDFVFCGSCLFRRGDVPALSYALAVCDPLWSRLFLHSSRPARSEY